MNKTSFVKARLTPEQDSHLKRLAKATGMTKSAVVCELLDRASTTVIQAPVVKLTLEGDNTTRQAEIA